MLAGLIFDDRSHPMSPSHANKKGVRYRYHVSQALLQNRKAEAGSIARGSAPDVGGARLRRLAADRSVYCADCQSARNRDPNFASKRDPFRCGSEATARPAELGWVAQPGRAAA
jgi:hypothetical protein